MHCVRKQNTSYETTLLGFWVYAHQEEFSSREVLAGSYNDIKAYIRAVRFFTKDRLKSQGVNWPDF